MELAYTHQNRRRAYLTICALFLQIILLFLLSYQFLDDSGNVWSAIYLSIAQIVLFYLTFFFASKIKSYFVLVYATYLIISHFGAIIIYKSYPSAINIVTGVGQFSWMDSYVAASAVTLSAIGVGSLSLGSLTALLGSGARTQLSKFTRKRYSMIENDNLYTYSLGLLFVCAIYIVVAVILGKIPIGKSYSEYRMAVSVLPGYPLFLLLLSISVSFAVSAARMNKIYLPLAVFAIPSFILLLTGNRGEVLFPAAGIVASLLSRGLRPRVSWIVSGFIIFFIVIPTLQKTREMSDSSYVQPTIQSVSNGFADPFVEIGFTLRPFIDTIEWIQSGEQFSRGGTYLLPLLTQFRKINPTAFSDYDIEKNDLQSREEGKGYSVLAEAYFNFSSAGICLIMFAVGYLLQMFTHHSKSDNLALFAAILTIMVNNLRNAFIFVPGHLIITILIFFAIAKISKLRRANV